MHAALPLLLVLALAAVAPAADAPEVRYANDRLTVRAANAPLPDVLAAIGKASRAEVRGTPADAPPVTLTLDDVPVKEALARLLGDQSFTLTYGENGALRAIDLRGGPSAAKPSGAAAAAEPPSEPKGWPPNEAAQQAADQLDQWTRADTRYPVTGRVAEALGTKEATFSQIAETAVTNDDPRTRSQALRAAMGLIESNKDIRNALVATLDNVDDAFLVNYVRFFMKGNAEEIVGALGRQSTTPALRTRAQGLLETLKSTPPPS